MFRKIIVVSIFLALIVNTIVFSQNFTHEVRETQERVPSDNYPSDNYPSKSDPNATESGSAYYEDYTVAERLGIGALNIFGGAGSITRGKRTGWLVTGIQGLGLLSILGGVIYGVLDTSTPTSAPGPDPNNVGSGGIGSEGFNDPSRTNLTRGLIATGSIVIGTGVIVGFVIPFFHQKSDSSGKVVQNDFPFNLGLVSSNGQDINGFNISYRMSF